MSIAIWFWVIYVIAILFNVWSTWPINRANAGGLVFFILIGLLGWAQFGGPVHR